MWRLMCGRIMVVGLVICVVALQIPPALSSGSFVFTSYEVPGAYQVFDTGHINNLGQIVGDYQQNTGYFRRYGFVLNPGGNIAPIDIVGFGSAGLRYPQFVPQFATAGINNAGTAVGSYTIYTQDFSQPYVTVYAVAAHAFIRDAAGKLTAFDVPGAMFTSAAGINDAGQIVGGYNSANGVWHGFLRNPDQTVTSIDVPGAVYTTAPAINNFGQILGTYATSFNGTRHGFVRNPDGTMTTVDAPGVPFAPVALNDLGEIVGNSSRTTALLREPDGTFIPIVAPAAALAPATNVSGINNLGQVVGRATYYQFDVHYFIAAQPVAQGQQVGPIVPMPRGPFAPGLPESIARLKMANCTWLQDNIGSIARAALGPTLIGGSVLVRRPTIIPKQLQVLGSGLFFLLQGSVAVEVFYTALVCLDPFDPNFSAIFQPRFYPFPPIAASDGIPTGVANTANSALDHMGRAASYLQAVDVTLNRYMSAVQNHDNASAALQQEALTRYQKSGSEELKAYGTDARELARLIRRTPLDFEISEGEVAAGLRDIRMRGIDALPALERGMFRMFGVTPSRALLNQLADVEPSAMPRSTFEALMMSARVADELAPRLEPHR